MNKLLIFSKPNLYRFVLIAVTIALFCGFHWVWMSISGVWWKILPIIGVLVLEDCALLLLCRHLFHCWEQDTKRYDKELTALSGCFLACFMSLAGLMAAYAWVNLYLFFGTIISALLLLFFGVCIIGVHDEVSFGRY